MMCTWLSNFGFVVVVLFLTYTECGCVTKKKEKADFMELKNKAKEK